MAQLNGIALALDAFRRPEGARQQAEKNNNTGKS
jgi:hypothetical protein